MEAGRRWDRSVGRAGQTRGAVGGRGILAKFAACTGNGAAVGRVGASRAGYWGCVWCCTRRAHSARFAGSTDRTRDVLAGLAEGAGAGVCGGVRPGWARLRAVSGIAAGKAAGTASTGSPARAVGIGTAAAGHTAVAAGTIAVKNSATVNHRAIAEVQAIMDMPSLRVAVPACSHHSIYSK